MIDHIGLTVRDLKVSKAFYDAAFAPPPRYLGAQVIGHAPHGHLN